MRRALVLAALAAASLPSPLPAVDRLPAPLAGLIDGHCADCHDGDGKKGGLDLSAVGFRPEDPRNFSLWVKIHDRVQSGEMPPKKRERPPEPERQAFLAGLDRALLAAETAQRRTDGRTTQRRLNRYEYENAVRDLLGAPWLQIRDTLPEDGEAHRFNKSGDALDVSHVQMARYLSAADYALRQVLARQLQAPPTTVTRYHARDQRSFTGAMKFSVFNTAPERATFPVLGQQGQPQVRAGKAPLTVGASDPATRDLEAVGVPAGNYEPLEPKFNGFKAPVAGHYRIRINALSVWIGPTKEEKGKPHRWWIPDLDDISPGRRSEPVTVYAEIPPRQLRWLGSFDALPEARPHELDVWLLAGETIRPDAARLFRSRPGAGRWQNPLAEKEGQPGVAFRWLEVEGPLIEQWPLAGHRLMFGDLPLRARPGGAVEVVSADPAADARRLLGGFAARAYRRPVAPREAERFLPVAEKILREGGAFADAMIAAYTAVLCSPEFLYLHEEPGRLDDHAVAARLAFFLTNTAPDAELRALAAAGRLRDPAVLRAQAERLLAGPKSPQFIHAFLDYWLDLRKIVATAPDSTLYPDYYLDDLLAESALEETRAFVAGLVAGDRPAREIVSADYAMLNERLAVHYGIPGVEGVAIRRVALPPDSARGGLLTQASVLKVTANGTTTSPVLRGVWVLERILGQPSPPPPPAIPAVEPDIRGASTIRQLLDKHRSEESCASCHVRIDPAGFALESFDVMGGFRERYRAVAEGKAPASGLGKGGQKFAFHLALPVDAAGQLPDGRAFRDIRELKALLVQDEAQLARNLVRQLVAYATGMPVRYGDRAAIEGILGRARERGYGVRTLIHELIQSDLFLMK